MVELLAVLAFLVLYPIAMLLFGALTGANPVVDGFHAPDVSIDNFAAVVANPNVHAALLNALIACTGGTALAVAWAILGSPKTGILDTAPKRNETLNKEWSRPQVGAVLGITVVGRCATLELRIRTSAAQKTAKVPMTSGESDDASER